MRESRKVSATMKGTPTFIAQVSDGLPAAPNLWPAMKTTCLTRGSSSSISRSSRSQATHSTPHEVSRSRKPGSEKRATPITRLPARRASRASVGPILPPTPSTMMSPSTRARSRVSSALGRVMNSSSASTLAKRAGRSRIASIIIAGDGALNLKLACARAKALATKPLKFTLTGPHMLAKTLQDRHYKNPERLAHAIADVLAEQVKHLDADVVQVDEANLPGHPDEWKWAAAAINKVLRAVPKKSKAAVHLCFGNYGGQSIQKGTWAKLMDYLNALKADHVVMETAHRPPQELEVFKELRRDIGFGLGVIDIKRTEIESASEVARTIERADKVLGKGRVKYIHPDCGFWMLPRNVADGKIRALAAGRDLYEK